MNASTTILNQVLNLSVKTMKEKSAKCSLYEDFQKYFVRCHTVHIIIIIVQELFPSCTSMDSLNEVISKISKLDREYFYNVIIDNISIYYKISQIVRSKLQFLFIMEDFVENVNRKCTKRKHVEVENIPKKKIKQQISMMKVYCNKDDRMIQTNYFIQMKNGEIYSINTLIDSFYLRLPYDISIIDEKSFLLTENIFLTLKKKNNCIDYLIDLDTGESNPKISRSKKYIIEFNDKNEEIFFIICSYYDENVSCK